MLHQSLNTMIRTQQDMLPIIQKAESIIFPGEGNAPYRQPVSRPQTKKYQLDESGKPPQTNLPNRHQSQQFLDAIHGLNPNSQVFKAIRFLRGEGIAIL